MHDHPQRRPDVSAALRAHGVKPTAQRVAIGRLVLAGPAHFSAEELYEQVNRGGQTHVSKATVYNTLGLFVDKGLLQQVRMDPGRVLYDSNVAPHHHFYDVDSGELEDIDTSRIEISALPETGAGVEVEGVDVVIRVRRSADAQ